MNYYSKFTLPFFQVCSNLAFEKIKKVLIFTLIGNASTHSLLYILFSCGLISIVASHIEFALSSSRTKSCSKLEHYREHGYYFHECWCTEYMICQYERKCCGTLFFQSVTNENHNQTGI